MSRSSSTHRSSSPDSRSLHQALNAYIDGEWITYQAPFDLDPSIYDDAIDPGVDAFASASTHTGVVADTTGGLRVQIGARTDAYTADAFAQWRIGRPVAGTTWYSFAASVAGRVGLAQRYVLSTGGINKYVRGPMEKDNALSFANHVTFTPPNDQSYVVSRIDLTAATSTAYDFNGTLSNIARTFVDLVDPTQPTISANFGFIAPSTFQASTSFSDAQSGCGGGTIQLINEAGAAVRAQEFAGCAATLTFASVPAGNYTLLSSVRDRAGRTSWNSTWLYVYGAPEVWVSAPLDGEYADASVLVTGGVDADNPFLSSYEIYVDGQLKASIPSSAPSFSYLLDTSSIAEGERTVTVVARDVAGSATSYDVAILVDHTAPDVEMLEPEEGFHARGTITLAADASDTVSEVTKLEFLLDGVVIGTRVGDQAYEVDLDTLPLSAGSHTLVVRATNSLGLARTSAPRTIVVDNVAPSATIITPDDGGTIRGDASFSIAVDDNFTVTDAQLNLYNSRNFQIHVGGAAAAGAYAYTLDTTRIQNGTYTLELVATDKAGNQTTVEQQVIVANPVYVMGSESWLSSSQIGPVSVGHATGNVQVASTDVDIPALGAALRVERTYNHQDTRVGSFGRGWSANFDRSITVGLDQVATYRDDDGTLHVFYPTDTGYERAIGLDADLTRLDGGGYQLRRVGGARELFGATGRLQKDVTRTGQAVTFERDVNGNIYSVADDSGLTIRIERNAEGLITALVGPANRRTQFTYDTNKTLIATANALGATTRFAYDAAGRLAAYTDALDNATRIEYANGRASRVTDAASVETSFAYTRSSVAATTSTRTTTYLLDELGRATSTTLADGTIQERSYDDAGHLSEYVNANGDAQTFSYDAAGNLVAETDFQGNTTRYGAHDPFGSAGTVTTPVGDVTRYTYDNEGNTIKTVKASGGVITSSYDDAGNKLTETDALGNTTAMNYDARGNLTRSVEPGGAATRYEVSLVGEVLTQTAPNGGETTYAYDAAGRQTSTTDAEGNTTATRYDALGRAVAETDGEGKTTTTAYNAVGNPTTVTNPAGGTQTTTYNAFGEAVAARNENGEVTTFVHDALGNVIAEVDPLGATTRFDVDAAGNVVRETTPTGDVTAYRYDADGRVVQTINPDAGTSETTYRADGSIASVTDEEGGITRYAYSPDGDQISATDPLGNTTQTLTNANGNSIGEIDELGNRTSVELDARGAAVRSTDSEGNQIRTVVDVMGNVTESIDANQKTTRYGYDKLSQLKTLTDPLGGVYAYTYNANGDITSETDELGRTTSFSYNSMGEMTAATNPAGGVDRFTYDAAGNVITDTDADGNTSTYIYDRAGQITGSVDPAGLTTRYAYDADGNLATETDPAGQITTYTFNAKGDLAAVRDPGGETTTYSYNRSGDLTAVTDPAGSATTYTYDAAHRVTSQTSTLDGTTTYTYSLRGELTSITGAAGTTTYTYTARGQLASITTPDGSRTTSTYDPAGNLLTITDESGTTRYTYDDADRLIGVTYADGTRLALTYNPAGELISQTTDGDTATYTYTSAGLLASASDAAGTTRFTHTRAGLLAGINRPSGLDTTLAYDDAGQLRSITNSDGDSYAYTYDAGGRITTTKNASGPNAYTYDARGQLTSWTLNGVATIYTYDVRGNLLRIDRSVTTVAQGPVPPGIQTQIESCLTSALADCNNPNIGNTIKCLTATTPTCIPAQLNGVEAHVARYFANYAVPVRTYTYDAAGRLTSLTDQLTRATERFTYDSRGNQTRADDATRAFDSQNRLISVATPTDTTTYTYDSAGLRTSRTLNGATTRFTYDPNGALIRTKMPDGAVVRFTHTAGALYSIKTSSGTYYLHYNSRGDTTRITNAAGDTIVRYTYTPWGETSASGDQLLIASNPFTYNGRDGVQYDPTTKLYWMGARHYDPRQGRFIQTDPEISTDDRSDAPYIYAGNDPINNSDADGKAIRRVTTTPRRVVQPRPRARIQTPRLARPAIQRATQRAVRVTARPTTIRRSTTPARTRRGTVTAVLPFFPKASSIGARAIQGKGGGPAGMIIGGIKRIGTNLWWLGVVNAPFASSGTVSIWLRTRPITGGQGRTVARISGWASPVTPVMSYWTYPGDGLFNWCYTINGSGTDVVGPFQIAYSKCVARWLRIS